MSPSRKVIEFTAFAAIALILLPPLVSCTHKQLAQGSPALVETRTAVSTEPAAVVVDTKAEPAMPPSFSSALEDLRAGRTGRAASALAAVRVSGSAGVWSARASYLLARLALEGGLPDTAASDALVYLIGAMGLAEVREYVYFDMARSLDMIGRHKEAATVYKTVVSGFPDSPLAPRSVFRMGAALNEAGELSAARDAFKEFIDTYPDDRLIPEALLNYSRTSVELFEPDEAAWSVSRLLVGYPENDAAAGAWELVKSGQVEVPEFTPDERFGRGKRLLSAARYDEAASEFDKLASGTTGNLRDRAVLMKARTLVRVKKYKEAEDVLKGLVKDNPGGPYELDSLYWLALSAARRSRTQLLNDVYETLTEKYPKSSQRAEVLAFIGNYHLGRGDNSAALAAFGRIIEDFAGTDDAEMALWKIGWIYYSAGDFKKSYRVFAGHEGKFSSYNLTDRVLYWSGRSAENVGHTAEAAAMYERLCAERGDGYYCFMALERLERMDARFKNGELAEMKVADAVATVYPGLINAHRELVGDRHYAAAMELMTMGLDDDAVGELGLLVSKYSSNPGALYTLAGMLYRAGEYHRAYRIYYKYLNGMEGLRTEGNIDAGDVYAYYVPLSEFSFPSELVKWVRRTIPSEYIDPYLVAAVMREESRFNPEVVSRTGAVGLMQIMPSTGRFIAKRLGEEDFDAKDLFNPETNIRLGAWYLGHLGKSFNNDIVLTIASYNAGPGAVKRWAKTLPEDSDEFIESIPYPETKAYAKRVLRSYNKFMKGAGEGREGQMPSK